MFNTPLFSTFILTLLAALSMDENVKRHFNIYKFIFFPWGIFTASPIWFGVVKALEWLIGSAGVSNPPRGLWISLFFLGEIAIILFLFFYPRILPKGKKNCHNFYVLIYPENMDDEKYIASDFISDFRSHASGIENLNIILPSIVKRQFFNSRIEMKGRRGQDYWKSKSWLRLHRKLGGILYISGSLSRRSSNKKEHFVFKLAATIGYNDLNKELTPIMINELQQNFPQQTLIDREFEFELFEAFSSKFATFSEYLIGWSHLISGSLLVAYRMHKDILNNNKQSFFSKGYLKDLRIIIRMEALAILKDCKKYPKAYIADCSDLLLSLFPEDTNTLIGISRSLIMTSSESDFDNSVTRALQLTSKAKMNKENRATLHANKAYLLLLKAKYSQAEDEYEIFFRKPAREVAEQIVQYCNEQIADGTDRERPTAHYVKVLMLSKIKADTEELYDAYEEAFKHIPESHYYHQKLKSMAITLKDSKTTKKKRRARQKQQK